MRAYPKKSQAIVDVGSLRTNDPQLAAFIALSRDLFRLFPLRGAGKEISKGQ